MRFTSQAQEDVLWQSLAVFWLAGSLLAWSAAALTPGRTVLDGGSLTIIALLVVGVSHSLRLPVLTASAHTPLLADHVVWLLAWMANLNWLGCLLLRSDSLLEALPALLLFCASECWLLHRVYCVACLPWLRQPLHDYRLRMAKLVGSSQPLASSDAPSRVTSDAVQPTGMAIEQPGSREQPGREMPADAQAVDRETPAQGLLRRSCDGVDEQGQRFASGEVRVEFDADQLSAEVVLGFVPAFGSRPNIELDILADERAEAQDAPECQFNIVTCTPAGARISLKRSPTRQPASLWLLWYASYTVETAGTTQLGPLSGLHDALP